MSMKLFVGGLNWKTSEEGLRSAFERFGNISEVKVIMDRETGRSRGFGFVTFSEDDAGRAAAIEMDGKELEGRAIKVNEAIERERAPRSGGHGSNYGKYRRENYRRDY